LLSITVTLLGTPRVTKDGQDLIFPYRKAEGLFYYLSTKGTVSRDEAIGIFWADCTETAARKNLRDAIYNLKKILGEDVIYAEGNNRISLKREKIASIDIESLTEENFLECYSGDFLGYFYVKNCIEFENWASEVRDEMHRRYLQAAQKRVAQLTEENNISALVACASSLLRQRVYEESLYREILDHMIRHGSFAEAEQLYQKLSSALLEELDTEPEEETVRLMQEAASIKSNHTPEKQSDPSPEYFFGREQEMMTLMGSLRNFEKGKPAASVLLTGEAGVGKSTILRKLKDMLRKDKFITIFYQCVQTEEGLYLKPWNDILSQAEQICKNLHIPMSPTPNFYSSQMDASLFATQYEIFAESVLQLLVQNEEGKKVVLFIDDIQWMDNASNRLLSNLSFWANNEKLLMILSSRDERQERLTELKAPLISRGVLQELKIARFTLEETKEIISERNPDLLEKQGFLEQLYQSTSGNALFLLEFLKELEHSGNTPTLSPKAASMIQSRLMNLSSEERELLEIISLYPRLATLEELQILSTQSTLQILRNLEGLLSRQLICLNSTFNKKGYGFSHQIIRDYVYDSLLEDKRQMLHTLLAEHYEAQYVRAADPGLFPMLIHHFSRCQNTIKAYTYRLEYLRSFYAVQHEIYPTVLTSSPQTDPHMPRLSSEDDLVTLSEQIRALKQRSPEVDLLRMKVEFLLGRYDLFSGSYEKGLKNIQMSIALAKKLNNSQYLLENYLQMVFHAIQIHDLDMFNEYLTSCESLLEVYRYSEIDVCTVLRLRGVYYMKDHQYDKAEDVFKKVIRILEPYYQMDSSYCVGLAACYNYLGEECQAKGDLENALKYYLQAIDCCPPESRISGMGVFYANAGYILYQLDELDQAQEHIDKANRCFAEGGAMWGRSRARSYAALLALKRGDLPGARAHLEAARESAQRGGNPSALSLVAEVEQLLNL